MMLQPWSCRLLYDRALGSVVQAPLTLLLWRQLLLGHGNSLSSQRCGSFCLPFPLSGMSKITAGDHWERKKFLTGS